MTLYLKDPGAVLDYSVDWGAEYLAGDVLTASDWSVAPEETDGVIVVGSDFDASSATVKVSGGIAGRIYRLVNRVVTEGGRLDERSVVLRVEAR